MQAYQESIAYWVQFTADPPIRKLDQGDPWDLTPETTKRLQEASRILANFLAGLWTLDGKKPGSKASAHTVHKHVTHIKAVFKTLGPPNLKNPKGAG